jgi:pimeloyl-ACP methyl ester carboxylesterase
MSTYLLIHGAWHGGWCWSRVAPRLRALGHEVYAPSLPGMGEHAHMLNRQITVDTQVEDVVALIQSRELEDVVLVGHSYGGLIITGVADRLHATRRLARLIYVDALVPRDGEGWQTFHKPERIESFHKSARDAAGLFLPAPADPGVFGVGPEDIPWLARHFTPHPYGCYLSMMSLPNLAKGQGAASLPRSYIDCVQPRYSDFNGLKPRLKADPAFQYVEIKTGHDAMVSAPAELVELLVAN